MYLPRKFGRREYKQEARNNRDFTFNQSAYKQVLKTLDLTSQIKYFLAQYCPNYQ